MDINEIKREDFEDLKNRHGLSDFKDWRLYYKIWTELMGDKQPTYKGGHIIIPDDIYEKGNQKF